MFAISTPIALYFWFLFFQGFVNLFPCLAITAVVASEGLGLDAVSAGELLTALEGGMPPERIVLHGNNKSSEELALAVQNGVTLSLIHI